MSSGIRSVAIMGDGPSGTTLATLLARAGRHVVVYGPGERPDLLVGESLVPAIVPILRELGVEDAVRSFSVHKPGATFVLNAEERQQFSFADVQGDLPGYAYNTPRDRFDRVLRDTCQAAGAHFVNARAKVELVDGRPRLTTASLAAAGDLLDGQPDWIVDATGRARTIAHLLDLPTRAGDRRDSALFAHLEGVPIDAEGHVHTDRLERGWAWRIPLPGRVSLGIVVDRAALRTFGTGAEEQYDGYLSSEPRLKALCGGSRRLTPVMRYDNYQLVSERGVGDGWALLGDAFGFVDPVFSSGLYIGMDSAFRLARAIEDGGRRAFARYERDVFRHIHAWQRIVGYFYDGRLFTLFKVGDRMAENWVGKLVSPHARKHLPRIFTGEATTRLYSRKLLDFMIEHSLLDYDPHDLMVN